MFRRGDAGAPQQRRHADDRAGHPAAWGDGGGLSSPLVDGKRPTDFDHVGEIVRFFNLSPRHRIRGIEQEPKIHFFTMGEERCEVTDSVRLREVTPLRWYLGSGNSLHEQPGAEVRTDRYVRQYLDWYRQFTNASASTFAGGRSGPAFPASDANVTGCCSPTTSHSQPIPRSRDARR